MQGNYVAKHMNKVCKAAIHKDRKRAAKAGVRKQKHKGRQIDGLCSFRGWYSGGLATHLADHIALKIDALHHLAVLTFNGDGCARQDTLHAAVVACA